jgi:beta-phosphoglucomutase
MSRKAVIFDLDGVIVTTDHYHYLAWKRMADEEGIYFDKHINERLRGVSRMESLEIILEKAKKEYSDGEKAELAERKNRYYKELLEELKPGDILPGVTDMLKELKQRQIKVAIGSSSKNTPFILEKINLSSYFDAVADGNSIKYSKPDPEVFLLAASKLAVKPEECVVVEDAEAGIEAALAGGMKAVGVGFAYNYSRINYGAKDMQFISVNELIK